MIDIIKNVFDVSNEILSKNNYVKIDEKKIEELAKKMLEDGKHSFYSDTQEDYRTGIYKEILKEIVACSINYCYWIGSHDIRPNNVSSTAMYEDVEKAFGTIGITGVPFERRIDNLISILSYNRYPLLEERKYHLLELCENRKAEQFATKIYRGQYTNEELFNDIVGMFSGFASDIFLKRVSLFFIQLYRRFGYFEDLMDELFVPADYQVPKILRHFNCIRYSDGLSNKIEHSILIQKNSIEELQIRAATIISCDMLKNITKWNICDIDTYLWGNRKLTNDPFHLTVTTNY